jgi:hypothetical protein
VGAAGNIAGETVACRTTVTCFSLHESGSGPRLRHAAMSAPCRLSGDKPDSFGMSERTLERRLAEQGVTFSQVLRQLKATLAMRYLEEPGIPISRIAWLLGFEDASSFSHACRRWTGKSPRELRRSRLIRGSQQKSWA